MSEDIKNGIQLCPDGKYRWAYEVNMYRNPTIFYVIANMFLICYLVCVVLFTVINLCLDEEVLSSILVLTGVFLFLFLNLILHQFSQSFTHKWIPPFYIIIRFCISRNTDL